MWQSNGRERTRGEAWEPESERRGTGGWGGERGLRALPLLPARYAYSLSKKTAPDIVLGGLGRRVVLFSSGTLCI